MFKIIISVVIALYFTLWYANTRIPSAEIKRKIIKNHEKKGTKYSKNLLNLQMIPFEENDRYFAFYQSERLKKFFNKRR